MAKSDKELKEKVLLHIWGWASSMAEGIDIGQLSPFFEDEVKINVLTEDEAMRAQIIMNAESDIIWRKLQRQKALNK